MRTGGNRVIFEVGTRLAARGHDVTFTMLSPVGIRWFDLAGCKVLYPKISEQLSSLVYTAPEVARHLLRHILLPPRSDKLKVLASAIPECDINVATFNPTAFAVHRSGRGVPFYYVLHHEPLFYEDGYLKRMAEETYYLPMKYITVSSWLRDLLREKYSKNSFLCFCGVNRSVFHPRKPRRDNGRRRVLAIGRERDPWKGLDDLLHALTIVHAERRDVELALVIQDKLLIPRTSFPVTLLRNHTDQELAEIYSQCDVYVSPSWYEGFALTPLEAMACGVPVVSTRLGVEDYASHEHNALITSPREPNQLANEIIRLLRDRDLREKLIENGLKTADALTWDKTTDRVEAAFKESLS